MGMLEENKGQEVDDSEFEVPNVITPHLESEYTKDFWEKMDRLFKRTISYAEKAFTLNTYVNYAVVITGIALVGYSILYSWLYELDLYSIAYGSLGVATFIATFYLNPQRRIQQLVSDLTQIQLFYRTYCIQWEHIADWQKENRNNMTLEDLKSLNTQLEELTINIAAKIEEQIGEKNANG